MSFNTPVYILVDAWFAEKRRRVNSKNLKALENAIHQLNERIQVVLNKQSDLELENKKFNAQVSEKEMAISSIEKRISNTVRAMNSGQISDYEVAEKRVKEFKSNISDLEDEVLEILDTIDTVPSRRLELEELLGFLGDKKNLKTQELDGLKPQLVANIKSEEDEIARLLEKLPTLDKRRFSSVMAKHENIIVPLKSNSCTSCYLSLPLKDVSIIIQIKSNYRCSNCGVFVVDASVLQRDD